MPASLLQREVRTDWASMLPAYQVTPVPAGNTSRFIARLRGAIGSPAPCDVCSSSADGSFADITSPDGPKHRRCEGERAMGF